MLLLGDMECYINDWIERISFSSHEIVASLEREFIQPTLELVVRVKQRFTSSVLVCCPFS